MGSGKSNAQLRHEKDKMMEVIHRIIIIHLGSPPTTFTWKGVDKDKNVICCKNITPLEFYEKYVPIDVNNYISIVNDPRNPYDRTMTVERLGNVVGGKDVIYINADVTDLWKYAKKTIDNDLPVWFGCEVGKDSSMRKNGLMSLKIFDYDMVFGTTPQMSKKDRLLYHNGEMSHAMLFTGYDLEEDAPPKEKVKKDEAAKEASTESSTPVVEKETSTTEEKRPTKWRVENSWGEDRGQKGYDIMTADWFDEHMYQVVIDKRFLSSEHLAVLETEPIHLPPWDPMGALAQ